MTFDTLGLSEKVLGAVTDAGFSEPTKIQAEAIPPALERKDVLGLAQTGSGKTAAFTLPMLNILEKGRARARMPRTLILEPTRELAAQVHEAFELLGKNHKLNIALLMGGVSFEEQNRKIDRGADVVIATPGRLLDHVERGKLMLTHIEIFVVDEADRMLDMGFIPDIERVAKLLPITRQTLFFSATMPPEIQRLTNQFLHNPVEIKAQALSSTAETITQRAVYAPSDDTSKRDALRDLMRGHADDVKNGIIFANRKTTVAVLEKSLQKHGFSCGALHGDMDQRARLKTLDAFRNNDITYLIASDVAARGLDIPDVSHVYNYDVPTHSEDYVHRIGRTGRAGRLGNAYTLVKWEEFRAIKDIEDLIKKPIDWDGEAPTDEEIAESIASKGKRRRGSKSAGPKAKAKAPAKKSKPKKAEEKVDVAEKQEQSSAEAKPEKRHSEEKPQRERGGRGRGRGGKGRDNDHDDTPSMFTEENMPAFLARPVI
ncbi:DEAD/DEAH box helicase [Anderseniella sp. Alg231-50]|uniref:DEAD/DEAH box helicase n=1 Tax=Anderseniella sp. Alg231-50 TaxID=1922226 RepID=UPI000D55F8E0